MNRLEGKVALITGGANGIGKGVAQRIVEEGGAVALVDFEPDALAETAAEMRAIGGRVATIAMDCTSADAPVAAFDQAEAELGPVDILVNNVGQGARERKATFLESSEDVWRFVIELNLMTTMRFSQPAAPHGRARQGNHIINMSSGIGGDCAGDDHDYGAAKAGIIGFTGRSRGWRARDHRRFDSAGANPHPRPRPERRRSEAKGVASILLPFLGEPADIGARRGDAGEQDGRYLTGQSIMPNGGRWFI